MTVLAISMGLAAIVLAANDGDTIPGWTETHALEALRDVRVSTVDPRFPDTQGYTASGFPISLVRMACTDAVPEPTDTCSGIWITAVLPATERQWAEKIVNSLERDANGPPGVHARVGQLANARGERSPTVVVSSYLIADGGVSTQLLPDQLAYLLRIVDQTREFMLTDDPAHAALWMHEE